MKKIIIECVTTAVIVISLNANADEWFGCGKIKKLNAYGASQIRFDIEGFDYEGRQICQYENDTIYGHHYIVKNDDNNWIFSMYLTAFSTGKKIRLYSNNQQNGPCPVGNVPIQFCD